MREIIFRSFRLQCLTESFSQPTREADCNQKPEIRIPKSETNSQTNKSQIEKIQNSESKEACLKFYLFLSFEYYFEFRNSCFEFFRVFTRVISFRLCKAILTENFKICLVSRRYATCLFSSNAAALKQAA